jgi:hypothetical protein
MPCKDIISIANCAFFSCLSSHFGPLRLGLGEFPPAALIAVDAIIIVACHLCRLDSFNAQLTSLSRHMPSCRLSLIKRLLAFLP